MTRSLEHMFGTDVICCDGHDWTCKKKQKKHQRSPSLQFLACPVPRLLLPSSVEALQTSDEARSGTPVTRWSKHRFRWDSPSGVCVTGVCHRSLKTPKSGTARRQTYKSAISHGAAPPNTRKRQYKWPQSSSASGHRPAGAELRGTPWVSTGSTGSTGSTPTCFCNECP